MRYFFPIIFSLFIQVMSAQVPFNMETILIDKSHYSSDITCLICVDLNNDGLKDLVVASNYDETILWYENVNGDLQHHQRRIIANNISIPACICASDLNNDGYADIIVASQYDDKVIWFQNLQDNSFSTESVIGMGVDSPQAIAADDIDNDGFTDVVVGAYNESKVILYKGLGNGNFEDRQLIYSASGPVSISIFDLTADGLKDVVTGHSNNAIFWAKNTGNGTFSQEQIISANSTGTAIDFMDVDTNGYYDIVTGAASSGKVQYFLNMNGENFSTQYLIPNSIFSPYQLRVKDIDGDAIPDIVASGWMTNKIGWYKNFNNQNFGSFDTITNNIYYPKSLLVEDIDDNGRNEIIASSHDSQNYTKNKLSIFEFDNSSDTYMENILNFLFGAVTDVVVADMNNDGEKDIVSTHRTVLLYKNWGEATYSSYYLVSGETTDRIIKDLEIADIDSDGFLDILYIDNDYFEILRNNHDETYSKAYTQSLDNKSEDLEVTDINNDSKPDIFITFSEGSILMGMILNKGNFSFDPMLSIEFMTIEYEPKRIESGDIDHDGDMDIAVSSSEGSAIQWLENDGAGNLIYHLIKSCFNTDEIALADFNNDQYLDIVSTGNYSYANEELGWFRYNGNQFSDFIKIDDQSMKAVFCADLNNDGYKDIVGSSYASFYPYVEELFYYLFDGNEFGSKTIIRSDNSTSLTRGLYVDDLNHDFNNDIVTSYYYINKVGYFLSDLPVGVETCERVCPTLLNIFPVPSSGLIYWDQNIQQADVSIFDLSGEKILFMPNYELNTLDIEFLKSGIYFIQFKSENSVQTYKIIKM